MRENLLRHAKHNAYVASAEIYWLMMLVLWGWQNTVETRRWTCGPTLSRFKKCNNS